MNIRYQQKVIRIIALTDKGKVLAERLFNSLCQVGLSDAEHCQLWFKPQPFTEKVQRAFCAGNMLIFIAATGIVVRTLASVINNKHIDPAVLVMDEHSQFVIPLLSGHQGRANIWADKIANLLKAQPVITTAKNYLEPLYAVGMGCERGCSKEQLQQLLNSCLQQAGIRLEQVKSINSIDLKADEPGLIALASALNKPFRTFDKNVLAQAEPLLSTYSDYVYKQVGVYGVAESAALIGASVSGQLNAKLLLTKQKNLQATCAIAKQAAVEKTDGLPNSLCSKDKTVLHNNTVLSASPTPLLGKLYLVSAGPGDKALLTPKATTAIEASSDLVAYGLYLDMLGDICEGKQHHKLPLGQEVARACLALNLAASGKTTALISSGDIGIYAMATLVFELLDQQLQPLHSTAIVSEPLTLYKESTLVLQTRWRDIEIEVIPGISAMQAAASCAGAMLGHDFCTISLSDLLTPWQSIEKRLHACGAGDFVVSFYNPRSQKRHWQINTARDILLQYRSPQTPVLLGRQLTRKDQSVIITTLEKLDASDVDMFTLVLVGNSESRHIVNGSQQWVYTPRGYSKKL